MTQRMIEITSPSFITDEHLASAASLSDLFGNDNPAALEIGCGIGDFIVQLARQMPEINFLAIDIYNKGCFKTCKKVDAAKLGNVKVLRMEARFLMTRFLGRNKLAAIYINCPDPWPKKRHHQRRLIDGDFLRLALYCLQPGGDFHFSTDFADYAGSVARDLAALPGFVNCQKAPFTFERPDYPLSKYMRRFLEQGQSIHFIHHRKRKDFQADAIPLPAVRPGFRVHWSRAENG